MTVSSVINLVTNARLMVAKGRDSLIIFDLATSFFIHLRHKSRPFQPSSGKNYVNYKLLLGPTAWCDKALARIVQCRCMSTNMEMKCGYAVVSAFTV